MHCKQNFVTDESGQNQTKNKNDTRLNGYFDEKMNKKKQSID